MPIDDAYRLSRIQAEGWNAAHRITAGSLENLDRAHIEYLNPYARDPERARWTIGFTSALSPAREGGTNHFGVGRPTTIRNSGRRD